MGDLAGLDLPDLAILLILIGAYMIIRPLVAFLERARPILQLYAQAREWPKRGLWLVCVDEKTSIQAREGIQPPEPAVPGQPTHTAPRYKRQGALHLFGGLSVADGKVYGQCRLRKRFVDFQAFLLEVIIPEALRRGVHTLALILDNGSTHAPKQLERWLKEQITLHGWALSIQVYWLPKNARGWIRSRSVSAFCSGSSCCRIISRVSLSGDRVDLAV